jgi:hypothetical protein
MIMKKLFVNTLMVICIGIFLGGVSCVYLPHSQWRSWMANYSNKDVYFVFSFDIIDEHYCYPSNEWPQFHTGLYYYLKPQERKPAGFPARGVLFRKNKYEDSLAVYIFDPDTIAKYTWEEIEATQNYLKKYEGLFLDILKEDLVYP